MGSEVVNIAGRYNKFHRNISQSPWIDKDDVRIKNSVQELIEDGIKKFLNFEKSTFASSGREDVDVRMLGRGRPFVFKIHNPTDINEFSEKTFRNLEDYVNKKYAGRIAIRDLQVVSKSSVSKNLTEGQESKTKEYRALCCCSRKLTPKDIELIDNSVDVIIAQKTPIRVLHRRSAATRKRTIHRMKIESVELEDYDCLQIDDLDKVFALILLAEAGTYIKEFVHGDFGRTQPNLSSLIGDCDIDLVELDVMEVYLDWPPSLENKQANQEACPIVDIKDEKMDNSDETLTKVYSEALKAMRDAESLPRGDDRQGFYMKSRNLFERASKMVESLQLFSDNEILDDVATVNLKYLLIPAYLAKNLVSSECVSDRLETFKRAEQFVKRFLQDISNYGLGNDKTDTALKSDCSSFSISGPTSLEAASQARNDKIEKFRKMQQLEGKLEELERRMKVGDDVDDEVAREFYTNLIKKWIEDMLECLEREVRPAIFFEENRSGNLGEPSRPVKSPKLDRLPDNTITIVKDQLQKQVFGIGYPSKPTVTVDEFIQKKLDDGSLAFQAQKEIYANSLQRYAEQPNLRRDQEEQSDEEREAKEDRDDTEEIARKRRWDDFKDETPRGSGNRDNMG